MRRALILVVGLVVAVLGAGVFGSPGIDAQNATPTAGGTASCPPTTLDEGKALVDRYWAEVWREGGEAAVPDLLATDETHHWGLGGDTVGHDAFAERLRGFLAAFPDLRIVPDQLVAEGDHVVSQWTATGTHEGDFFGIAPTGRRVTWTGIQFFRLECGKIAESWGEADHLGLRQQLGALPAPGTPVAATPAA